jgi:tRNA (cytidine32/uridine32-2'-O)-methyltransferase
MTNNIRIVLIKTWHAGNIGAAARAMKNMGLSELYLVDPVDFPSSEATSRAGQATDVLENAKIVESLEDALADCALVIGTSARDRSIALPSLSAEQSATKAIAEQTNAKVAFVFGRERTGMHNDEIQQCHFQLNIDANPDYPVLNLSQAVQIVSYEIFKASQDTKITTESEPYPEIRELKHFLEHLEAVSFETGFIKKSHPGMTLEHMQAMFRRARMTKKELSIMRGFLSTISKDNS